MLKGWTKKEIDFGVTYTQNDYGSFLEVFITPVGISCACFESDGSTLPNGVELWSSRTVVLTNKEWRHFLKVQDEMIGNKEYQRTLPNQCSIDDIV